MSTSIETIKGNYLIRNPYTKGNKNTLPFNILGESYNPKYPVRVETFEYKGTKRNRVIAQYTIESALQIIGK